MKPKHRNPLLAAFISFTFAASSAQAVDYYWDNNGTTTGYGTAGGTWAAPTVSQWSTSNVGTATPGASITTATTDTVNFGLGTTGNGLAAGTITVSGTVSTGNMTFGSLSGAITLSGGIINLGGSRTITSNNTGNVISSELALTGASTFSIGEAGGAVTRQLTLGKLSGTGGVTFQYTGGSNGTGLIVLNQGSTYTGTTLISTSLTNANTEVRLGVANALPTTTVLTIGGVEGTGTSPGRRTQLNLNGNNQTLAGLATTGGGTLRTQNVFSSTAATLTINDSGNRTFAGLIGNGGTNVSVTKQGAGNWTLSGANTYVGQTTVSAGTITVSNAAALGATAGNTVVSSGGRIFVGTNSLSVAEPFSITGTGSSSNGAINIGSNATGVAFTGAITLGGNATIQGDGGTTTTFSGGIDLGANTLTFKEGGTITVNTAAISGTGGSIIKNTGGQTNLNFANTYTGDTTVNAGILSLGVSTAAGVGGTINLGDTTGTANATLRLSGTSTNVANALTVRTGSSGTKTISNASSNNTTYSGDITADDNLSIVGAMTGTATFTLSGTANTIAAGKTVSFSNTSASSGNFSDNAIWGGDGATSYSGTSSTSSLAISGAKTYTGGSTVGSFSGTGAAVIATSSVGTGAGVTSGAFGTGTLTLGNGAKLRSTNGADTTVGNALTLAGDITAVTVSSEKSLIFSGPATLTGTRTFDVSIGNTVAGKSLTFSGAIGESGGAQGLTKAGTGLMVLSGENTYTGTTTLNAGTLNLGSAETVDVSGPLGKQLANAVGTIVLGGGTLQYSAANQFDYSGRFSTAASQAYNVNTNGQNVTWAADLVSSGGTLTKTGAGILTISGTNSYTGLATVSTGTLLATKAAALPGYNAAGRVSVATAASLAVRAGGAGEWISTELDDLLGATTAAFATGTTLGIDVGTTFTYGNDIGATQAAKGLVKSGAGILTLSGANTYTGTTTIGEGTLAFTTANTLSGGLVFGATSGTATTGGLDLSAASATFGGSLVAQTDSASANTIAIGSGQTLQLNGAVTVGYNSSANSTSKLTATGAGTLAMGTTGAPTNAGVQIGNGQTSGAGNAGTLDLSGLANFNAYLGTGTFRIGSTSNGSGANTNGGSTVILASTSTISATTLQLSSEDGSGATQTLKLGSGTNVLNANTINVSGARSNGTVNFNGASGTLTVRSLTDPIDGRATLNIGVSTFGTGTNIAGTFDTTGHSADLRFGTMTLGSRGATGTWTGGGTGNFSFDTGSLDANDLSAGFITGTATNAMSATGNMSLSGGTATFNATTNALRLGSNSRSAGTATGNLNISGTANVTVAANGGNSIILGNATLAGGTATGALNITGGSLTVAGDIIRGTATGTSNATLAINGAGAILDMGGNDITSLTGITYTDGTLKNLGTVNTGMTLAGTGSRVFDQGAGISGEIQGAITGTGIGLTKQGDGKLTLSGANSYDGATLVSAGTLFVTGSLTSDVTVSNTATVGGGGSVQAISFGGGSFFDIFAAVNGLDSLASTTISFAAAGFGIDNLVSQGLPVNWGSISNGTYTLITGTLTETNLGNLGSADPYDIGGGRTAYFENGSLNLVVIPEPSTALLGALGALMLLRRRR